MKRMNSFWTAGLALLVCAVGVTWLYTVGFMKWNVPLYGVGLATICLGAFLALRVRRRKEEE